MKTIDKLKKRFLENPKIKMIAFNFPQGANSTVVLSDILEEKVDQKYFLSPELQSKLLTSLEEQRQECGTKTGLYCINTRTREDEIHYEQSPTLTAPAHKEMYRVAVPLAWSKSHRTGRSESDKRRKNYGQIEERVKIGEFNTLSTGVGGGNQSTANFVAQDFKIRRLTPVECARLQGFPDDWHKGLSDTQAYKCYGNAVTVNVIYNLFFNTNLCTD